MNMTKISTLLTSIALASSPILAEAYQIAPNPNPVGNTINVLDSDAEASNFTNFGILHIGSSGTLKSGQLVNALGGNLNIDAGGTFNLFGGAAIFNSGTINNNGALHDNFDQALINESDGIINNSGFFEFYSFANFGTVNNNPGGIINAGYGITNFGTLINNGTLSISFGREFYNNAGSTLTNNGTLLYGGTGYGGLAEWGLGNNSGIINGSGIYIQGPANCPPGYCTMENNGSISQSSFQINAGIVSGIGSFTGETTIASGATVDPAEDERGFSNLDQTGTLTFNGDFHSSGNLRFDIDGTGTGLYDVLAINGNADFTGGNVLFNFTNGFHPSVRDHWNFLLADSITGLDSLNLSFAGLPDSNEIKGDITFDNLGGHMVITALPVPEPEIYTMLLAGLGLVGFVARRRKEADTTNAH